MKATLKFIATTLLGIACTSRALAGDQFFDLDSDPAAVPGFFIFGQHLGSHWNGFDGNPASGGYVSITDAVDGQNLCMIFPSVDLFTNVDNSVINVPIKAFRIEADLRVGNSTDADGRPADGFSISFARDPQDPVIYWATNGAAFRGFAGGDSCAEATQPANNPAGASSTTAENGTKTGLAIIFDAWQGNTLPNTAADPNCVGGNDVEGIAVRVDDRTLIQVPMATRNGACDNTNSVQTGPWLNDGGTYTGLCWAHLIAELDTNAQVTVSYKGRVMLDHFQLTNFPTPLNARLILAGRTGGNNQNTHVDNLHVVTVPSIQATLDSILGKVSGFTFSLKDFGPSQVTNVQQVLLDSVDVTASTVISKSGVFTSGVYTQAARFVASSTHTVRIVVRDTVPQTLTFNTSFTVPNWILLPTNLAQSLAVVNTNKPGFLVNSWQGYRPYSQPNQLVFTEEQILGYWGTNAADTSAATGPGGLFVWDREIDFANPGNPGRFPNDNDWINFGHTLITGNYDNNTAEFFGYVYFPSNGIYQMRLGSDDGFQVSVGPQSRDRMGTVVMSFNGGRGIAANQDVRPVIVDQAGVYPMRLLFENGGGGSALEWYFEFPGATAPGDFILVNDTNTPGAILAYSELLPGASAGPYVQKAVPVRNAVWHSPDAPIIVDLGNGTGTKTLNNTSIVMRVDNVLQNIAISTPSAGITRVTRAAGTPYPGTHTIILTYADNAANNYTNTWSFTVVNTLSMTAIPASNAVPISAVDFAQPGFRVFSYQTDPAQGGVASPTTVGWTESQLQGLQGPNVANLTTPLLGFDYFVWNGGIDFDDGDGEGFFDAPNQNLDFFGFQAVGGGANRANCSLLIGGWLVFSNAGNYVMRITSDDVFFLSSAYGNPFNADGAKISWFDGGRGSAGWNGGDWFKVSIPTPGAYPFRLLFNNGGGGFGVEWSALKQLPDGSYRQIVVNDPDDAGSIRAYQATTQDAPLVKGVNPPPGFNGIGNGTPGFPFINLRRTADISFTLEDAATSVKTNTIALRLKWPPCLLVDCCPGCPGNLSITNFVITQDTNGIVADLFTHITASGAAGWPSGVRGKLELSYQDSLGRTHVQSWDIVTEFYGTLAGGYPLGSGDPTKRGFLMNMYQVHRLGGVNTANRIQNAEQELVGLLTNNVVAPGSGPGGAYINAGVGENGTNGLVNFNQDAPANAGRFNAGNARTDRQFPGMPAGLPSAGGVNFDSFGAEVLTYVEFPTNGTYRMTVASDDGFRLTRGHARPQDKGQLIVNSPSVVAGEKSAVPSTVVSAQVLSRITADLVQALGVNDGSGLSTGSTNPREGCGITNGAALAGKIALIYRGACGFYEKVLRAQQAGAIAAVIVNNRPVNTPGDGWFPIEIGIVGNNAVALDIPAIMISLKDGDALSTTLTGGTNVNVTITPMELAYNPPALNSPLGQADVGKGDSDVDFTVIVPEAGVYPLRLIWFEGGGGANLEWYSWPDGVTRALINDDSAAVPALKAYYGVTVNPSVSLTRSGNSITISNTGTLQRSAVVTGPYTDVYGNGPTTEPANAPQRYYRSRQ